MPPRPGTAPAAATAAPSAPSATPPSAGPPSAPAPSTPVAAFSGVIDGVDQAWTDWAIGMAQANADFNTFIDQCMTTDGVMELPLLQQALMSQKPGSLWATHHG